MRARQLSLLEIFEPASLHGSPVLPDIRDLGEAHRELLLHAIEGRVGWKEFREPAFKEANSLKKLVSFSTRWLPYSADSVVPPTS